MLAGKLSSTSPSSDECFVGFHDRELEAGGVVSGFSIFFLIFLFFLFYLS